MPVFSFNTFDTSLPSFASSESIARSDVPAVAVLMPCLVMVTIAADTFSMLVLYAAAVGMTVPSVEPSSPTVVLPSFCVVISMSEISVAWLVSRP